MKITINYGDGVINIPLAAMNNIELIGENELKLLVYICRMGNGDFNTENAQVTLGLSPSEIDSALAFLRGAGLVKQGKGRIAAKEKAVPAREDAAGDKKEEFVTVKSGAGKVKIVTDAPPQYSGPELDNLVTENSTIGRLKSEAESEMMFNRPLHHAELNLLITLFDYYGFDEAYILQLLSISKDKSNPMKYAYKLGSEFYGKGITSYEMLLEELARMEERNCFEYKMRKLFGIEKRSLTAKENTYFAQWQSLDYELVEYAYELTVDSTGKASMPYMNKILTSFEEQGIKSAAEAKEKQKSYRDNAKSAKSGNFDEKDFFAIALEGSYMKEKQKSQNGNGGKKE